MLIKEFAELAGVSPDTVRFYEKRGLLKPAARGASNGYRRYGEKELEVIQQIQIGQTLGFSLAEIRAGAEAWMRGEFTPAMQVAMMSAKLQEVERKQQQLLTIADYLRRKIAWIKGGEQGPKPQWTQGNLDCPGSTTPPEPMR